MYAAIEKFLSISTADTSDFHCVIYKPLMEKDAFFNEEEAPEEVACHLVMLNTIIKNVEKREEISACLINQIQNRVAFVEHDQKIRLVQVPNCYERD